MRNVATLNCSNLRLTCTFVVGFFLGFIVPQSLIFFKETASQTTKLFVKIDPVNNDLPTLQKNSVDLSNVNDRNSSPKVLCYILTGPSRHDITVHIKDTWGKRCDKLIFFWYNFHTAEDDRLYPQILNVTEGYDHLWQKSKEAVKFLSINHPHFDWYLKADDDTYVIIENLKYFLTNENPQDPVYYGVKFKKFIKQGYMSGGGGYVLSREALHRLANIALNQSVNSTCQHEKDTGPEDLHIGRCMESVGVRAGDSLDNGKPRFFSHGPTSLFFKGDHINIMNWYWQYIWHKHELGLECCSNYTISFHDINPRMMWCIEMLLYNIKIHS